MMMEKSGTLLIAERGGALSQNLDFWITEQGHRLKAVDNIKDLLMTLQNEKIQCAGHGCAPAGSHGL